MKVKVVDEKGNEIYNTDLPDCKKLNACGCYESFTAAKPYIFESVTYLCDIPDKQDEIIIKVKRKVKLAIDGKKVKWL